MLADTGAEEARGPVERLLALVRGQSWSWRDAPIRVTVSAGVAEVRADDTVASWLARADEALYAAKHQGRDRAVYAS